MQVYEFLLLLPTQDDIHTLVLSDAAKPSDLIPVGKKYKAMYSLHSLKSHLKEQERMVRSNKALEYLRVLTQRRTPSITISLYAESG